MVHKKVLLDFFQKIAESRGSASGRASQGAKSPSVQSAIRRWRSLRPKANAPGVTLKRVNTGGVFLFDYSSRTIPGLFTV